jgi:hypothetical protein
MACLSRMMELQNDEVIAKCNQKELNKKRGSFREIVDDGLKSNKNSNSFLPFK